MLSTWPVTTLDDSPDEGTLRWAITQANQPNTGDDTITFAQGLTGTITLDSALPELSDTTGRIDIKGPGAESMTVARSSEPSTPDFRIVTIGAGATVNLVGLTITGGIADFGGGVYNTGKVKIERSVVSGNSSQSGGGAENRFGTMSIVDSTFNQNSGAVGGIVNYHGTLTIIDSTFTQNYGPWGGAIHSTSSDPEFSSRVTIVDSTVANNRGNNGGGITNSTGSAMTIQGCAIVGNAGWNGGGIHNTLGGDLTIINSTISGNTANLERGGGGIFNWYDIRSTRVLNCTIVNNTGADGGGILNWAGIDPSAVVLHNTLVAGNTDSAGIRDDVSGPQNTSSSYNLISVGTGMLGLSNGVGGNVVGTADSPLDPLLGPLQDNGGPTWTMALLPRSPAIDAGIAVDGVTTDQRGMSRTASGPADIGAFELVSLTMNPILVNNGAAQRSNVTSLAVPFNQWTNLQSLIDAGTIGSAVQLFGAGNVPLESARYHYDRDTFTLTVDLRLSGSQQTMLEDGKYELRIDTSQVFALGNPTNPLRDNDGNPDGSARAGFHQLVGDFNGDRAVTIADRTILMQHYGAKAGQSLYDFAFDLNGDGIINLQDYVLWLKKLGRTV